MTSVHFAVLTHNRSASLSALLRSIASQAGHADTSITILDNGSTRDHADAVCRLAEQHGAELIRSRANIFMAGRRVLEDHVLGGIGMDVLVHFDDDVVLGPGWLRATLYELDTGVAACGSVEDRRGDRVLSGQRQLELTELELDGRRLRAWDWQWHSPRPQQTSEPVEFAGHRALAVRTDVARSVRHDPALVAGGDDVDYSLALRAAGHQLHIAYDALIVHRSMNEADISEPRTSERVVSSWRHFHTKWGFVRRNAGTDAGMSLHDFAAAVLTPAAPEGCANDSERFGGRDDE